MSLSKALVPGLVLLAVSGTAVLLSGMSPPRDDSIVARDVTIVDAQGRKRIALLVDDRGAAGISLYHPNGQALLSILADEQGTSLSMGTADGKPRATLRTRADGTSSFQVLDAGGAETEEVKAEPKDVAPALESAKRGPSFTRLPAGIYQDAQGTIAAYAAGSSEAQSASSEQRRQALNAARKDVAAVLLPYLESILIPNFLSAAAKRQSLGDATDAISREDEDLARRILSSFLANAQQIDSFLDERDRDLWVLLWIQLDDTALVNYLNQANVELRATLQAHSIELSVASRRICRVPSKLRSRRCRRPPSRCRTTS